MQELRTDGLTGERVIVAPGRATRPEVFRAAAGASAPPSTPPDSCPFCEGHEAMTPPEVARVGGGAPDTPGWQVRVVPNKYPIVGDGVPGAHEVIVLSPAHDHEIDALPLDAATAALVAVRERAAHHLDSGCAHAQPLLNHGRASGASIEHPHAQLIALAFTPPEVDKLLARFDDAGRDVVADEIAAARGGPGLVRDADAVTWCSPGAISPFRTRIAVPAAGARFDRAADGEVRAVTEALQHLLARLHDALGEIAYNVVVNTAPRDDQRPFHWWIDVVPRIGVYGGFELGTGVWVNPMAPETAATTLREA
jgi:UDPglucose--hexose-1-phosphate uridylyltransferase